MKGRGYDDGDEPAEAPENARSLAEAAARRQAIGARLVRLSDEDLSRVRLDERLLDAVLEARRLPPRTEALRRQLQFVGKLMRGTDADEIARQIELVAGGVYKMRLQRDAERWRDRLLAGGDAALQELVGEHPAADRQRLRQLVRKVRREAPESPTRAARARELTAAVRAVLELELEGGAAAPPMRRS